MLSYQHMYHAGNAADVHKHSILALLMHSLTRDSKQLHYFETHSGRGRYDLTAPEAKRNAEFMQGINRLWLLPPHLLPFGVKKLLGVVRGMNERGLLLSYPGSPWIALQLLRKHDPLHLCELHPREFDALKRCFAPHRHVRLFYRNGHDQVPELLDANQKNLILIDPSFEVKQEYQQTVETVDYMLQQAPRAIIAVWYPILPAGYHLPMVKALQQLLPRDTLLSELRTHEPRDSGRGMLGSGVLVLNAPKALAEPAQESGQFLAQRLEAVANTGHYTQQP